MSAQTLKRIGISLIALAVFTAAASLWLALPRSRYTVYADGEVLSVSGSYVTVEEVISAAGVSVGENDQVQPALNNSAEPDIAIAVHRAQPVRLRTEAGNQTYWTHQETVGDFLAEIQFPTNRTDKIYADGKQLSFNEIFEAPLTAEIEIGQFKTITIQDESDQWVVRTTQQTVGKALHEAGVTIYAADGTTPSLDSWLTDEMLIRIRRSQPVTIQVDGRVIQTRSHHTTPLKILAEAGIGLVGLDYTIPDMHAEIAPNEVVSVVRVTEDFRLEEEPIAYESALQPTDQFEIDQRGVLQAGAPGILRRRVRIRYENGVKVSETADGEWVALEPVNEVVGYGTRIVVRTLDTPEGPVEYWRKVRMRVTSYMAQTSGKPPDHPGYGITASGVVAGYGVVAVDPRVVPFRSSVYVPGYGQAFVGDTGGGVKGRWIDLGYEDDWDTFEHWSGYTEVYYLTPVPPPEKINFLIPTGLP